MNTVLPKNGIWPLWPNAQICMGRIVKPWDLGIAQFQTSRQNQQEAGFIQLQCGISGMYVLAPLTEMGWHYIIDAGRSLYITSDHGQ